MPPPTLDDPSLDLSLSKEDFFVIKVAALDHELLGTLAHESGKFFSITRTEDEVSVVGEAYEGMPTQFQDHCTWRPMEHNLTGVLASFTAPLKIAQVPIFAVSTWNTDYVLVPKVKISAAAKALSDDGWTFTLESLKA